MITALILVLIVGAAVVVVLDYAAVRFLFQIDRRLYYVTCEVCGAKNPSFSWRRL